MISLNLFTSKYLSTNIRIIVSAKTFIIDFLVVYPRHSIGIAKE